MKTNRFDVSQKTMLITGSSGGLGLKFAHGLGQEGAQVILNGRSKEKLQKAVTALQKEGLRAYGYGFNVTKESEIQDAMTRIKSDIGQIDVLINNAGVMIRGPLHEIKSDEWQQVLDVHLNGAYLMAKHVVPGMIERGAGKIINICSLMSELGRPTVGPYTAAKGGLKMLTKAMAVDWAKHNIQVNGIGPGYFLTEMTQKLADDPEFDDWLKKRTPAGRWGKPEELLGAVQFLSSSASDFVNGQIIYVDGGILASL